MGHTRITREIKSDLSGMTIRVGKGNERKHNGCLFEMNTDIYSVATSLFASKNNISETIFIFRLQQL